MSDKRSKYSVNKVIQFMNDNTGERIDVGPDADGVDLLTITQYDSQGAVLNTMSLTQEQWDIIRRIDYTDIFVQCAGELVGD